MLHNTPNWPFNFKTKIWVEINDQSSGTHNTESLIHNVIKKLIQKKLIQIKSGVTINVGVSAKIQKDLMHVKKVITGIPLLAAVKMATMY